MPSLRWSASRVATPSPCIASRSSASPTRPSASSTSCSPRSSPRASASVPRHLGLRVPAPVLLRPVRVPRHRQGPHRYAPHGHALPRALLLRRGCRPRFAPIKPFKFKFKAAKKSTSAKTPPPRPGSPPGPGRPSKKPRARVPKTKGLARRAVQVARQDKWSSFFLNEHTRHIVASSRHEGASCPDCLAAAPGAPCAPA